MVCGVMVEVCLGDVLVEINIGIIGVGNVLMGIVDFLLIDIMVFENVIFGMY